MSERTGIDAVTLSVLETLDGLDARPDSFYRKSAGVVERVYTETGIPSGLAYEAVCATSAVWLVPIPLVDFHGNLGSSDSRDEPAGARYTEIRLSVAGTMALASERGELPRLPVRLVNGDLALGGSAPSFDPVRLAAALRATGRGDSDDALVELLGLPSFPTGCTVDGDLAQLASGQPTKLRLSARVEIEEHNGGSRLVITNFPFGVGADAAAESNEDRVSAARNPEAFEAHEELSATLDIAMQSIRNESIGDTQRVVCDVAPGGDPEVCRARVLDTWPVRIELTVHLGAPLAAILRDLVDGSEAQQQAFAKFLTLPPPPPQSGVSGIRFG
jgi:hypothetical protein